jgi:hypothetical protein
MVSGCRLLVHYRRLQGLTLQLAPVLYAKQIDLARAGKSERQETVGCPVFLSEDLAATSQRLHIIYARFSLACAHLG